MGSKPKIKFESVLKKTTRSNRSIRDETGLDKNTALAAHRRFDPDGARPFLSTERANLICQRRLKTLNRFKYLRRRHTAERAAQIVGSSVPTLWRWQKRFAARGLAGLRPIQFKPGRPRGPLAKIRLPIVAQHELELLAANLNGFGAAWRYFANASPACPPLIATHVQRTCSAPYRLASVARITPVKAFISIDGRRVFVKLPGRSALTAKLSAPEKFNLARLAK